LTIASVFETVGLL